MFFFKQKPKKYSKINTFKDILSSLLIIMESGIEIKQLIVNGIHQLKLLILNVKLYSKNAYETNMNLAIFHLQKGNMIDAKFRYYIARFADKKQAAPLLGLAEIAIHKEKYNQAELYLQLAITLAKNAKEKEEILAILKYIS